MQEHKDQTHKENKGQKCHMCGYFSHDKVSFVKHQKMHQAELNVGSTKRYPIIVYKLHVIRVSYLSGHTKTS